MASRTFEQLADSLAPDRDLNKFLLWPPDLFALTSTLLAESDAYIHCISPRGERCWPPSDDWGANVARTASSWIKALNAPDSRGIHAPDDAWDLTLGSFEWEHDLPADLVEKWNVIRARPESSLRELAADLDWVVALLTLHAIADESGARFGRELQLDSVHFLAFERMQQSGTLAMIDPSRGRVLPKYHTPQSGISLRSLSSHLAFDRSATRVVWNDSFGVAIPHPTTIRCLVLPWPLTTKTSDFRTCRSTYLPMRDGDFGFFEFSPGEHASTEQFRLYLASALDAAVVETGAIDIVVLPEIAVNDEQVNVLRETCAKFSVGMFVCGVRRAPVGDNLGESLAVTGMRHRPSKSGAPENAPHTGSGTAHAVDTGEYRSTEQHKHHRWCLDPRQVSQYQLGGALHSSHSWWEAIQIRERTLAVNALGSGLAFCTLVCEDLARQDPMAGLIRAIGPSLVIALLMDGPQLQSRWPARYATVFADDPGSSVLTVTSLGMAERSLGPDGRRSRVIALWKDSTSGPREIALEPNHVGVVLSFCAQRKTERTADARSPGPHPCQAVVLSGVVQIASQLRGG